ncbi:MAG: hypothetical protein J5584_03690 [Clostridia bacterium]|nr:hypothetical protein [Clostridia bacterium]
MRELNIQFIDQYKIVDCFIRDAYKSEEGVSEYIKIMEQNDAEGKEMVVSWGSDHRSLKHLRWLRNKLAHEVGFDSDLCTKSDLACLSAFDERLRSAEDPLSKLMKAKEAKRQLAEQRKRELAEQRQQQVRTSRKSETVAAAERQNKKTIWQRIKDFFFDES